MAKYVDVEPIIDEIYEELDKFAKTENRGIITDSYIEGARKVLMVLRFAKGVEINAKEDVK